MNRIGLIAIFIVLFIIGCDGSEQQANICYIPTSSNPCFDPNVGGSTTIVANQTVDEVIEDQENMQGFQMSLAITDIIETLAFIGQGPPNCPYEQNELVIKTANDWDRFRNSCFFSFFDLPDVNFQNDMVLVSTQAFAQLGTTIEAVLEFNDRLSVVIEDDITNISPPAPAFPINIVSVSRVDLPVDFIRVENDVTPTGT